MNIENEKRYSAPCERNQEVIAEVLEEYFGERRKVLEIGSGTGQHAVYFAARLGYLTWQPSNPAGDLGSIRAWAAEASLENLRDPIELDLFDSDWSAQLESGAKPDAMVAINVIHIAPWEATRRLFSHARQVMAPGGLVFFYGPYRYEDRPLEPSNSRFDQWLKERDPASGIRSFEAVDEVARAHGFSLLEDRAMPANNRAIIWRLDPRQGQIP